MADIAELGIRADSSDLKRAGNDLDQFGRKARGAADATDRMSRRMGAAFGLVAARALAMASAFVGIGRVISVISDFESSMSRLGAISGAAADDLEHMRDVAKTLGATTEFTASQVATAMGNMSAAGLDTAEILKTIPTTIDLTTIAQTGDIDSMSAALTTALNVFQEGASEAQRFGDVVTATYQNSATNITELFQAIERGGAIAKNVGLEVEDMAAVLAGLAQGGYKAAEGGTAFRNITAILAGIETAPQIARDAIQELGLSFDDLDPTDLIGTFEKFKAAFEGIESEAERTALALAIFGRESSNAFLSAVANTDKMREVEEILKDVEGRSKSLAEYMRNNLGGDLSSLNSAVEGLIISMGEAGLTNILRGLIQGLTSLVGKIGGAIDIFGDAVRAFDELTGASEYLKTAFTIVGNAIQGFLAILSGRLIATLAGPLISALGGAGRFMVGLGQAAIAGRAGIIGLAFAFTRLAGAIRIVRGLIRASLFGLAVEGAIRLYQWISNIIQNTDTWGRAFFALGNGIARTFEGIGNTLSGVSKIIRATFLEMFAAVVEFVGSAVDWINAKITELVESVSKIPEKISGAFDSIYSDAVSGEEIGTRTLEAPNNAPIEFTSDGDAFQQIQSIIDGAGYFTVKINGIEVDFNAADLKNTFDEVIADGVIDPKEFFPEDWVNTVEFSDEIIRGLTSVMEAVKAAVPTEGIDIPVDTSGFDDLPGRANTAMSEVAGVAQRGGRMAGDQLTSGFQAGASQTAAVAAATAQQIQAAFTSIDMTSAGQAIVQGLVVGIQQKGAEAVAAAQNVAAQIKAAVAGSLQIQSPSKVTERMGRNVSEGLAIGITSGTSEVTAAANQLANAAVAGFDTVNVPLPGAVTDYAGELRGQAELLRTQGNIDLANGIFGGGGAFSELNAVVAGLKEVNAVLPEVANNVINVDFNGKTATGGLTEFASAADMVSNSAANMNSALENANQGMSKFQSFKDIATQGLKTIGDALATAIVNGENLGEALGNAFKQIAQQFISNGINMILQSFFGGVFGGGGGIGGGLLGGLLGGAPSFDGGGYTGDGSRSGGLDGKGGYMAMLHPQEYVHDLTKPAPTMASQSGSENVNVQVELAFNDNGNLEVVSERVIRRRAPEIVSTSVRAVNDQMYVNPTFGKQRA